jgi:hypothetical protein
MGLYEFNVLSIGEKAVAVWSENRFLIAKTEGNEVHALYNVSNFFAEVIYNRDENKIVEIRAFKSNMKLQGYLEGISLRFL